MKVCLFLSNGQYSRLGCAPVLVSGSPSKHLDGHWYIYNVREAMTLDHMSSCVLLEPSQVRSLGLELV